MHRGIHAGVEEISDPRNALGAARTASCDHRECDPSQPNRQQQLHNGDTEVERG